MFRLSLLAGTAVVLLSQSAFAQVAAPTPAPAANSDGGSGAGSADADAQLNAATGLPADLALVSGPALSEGPQVVPVDPAPPPTAASPGDVSRSSQPPLTVRAPPNPDDAIVVTGRRRRTDDVLGDVAVLSGASLAENVRPTIGETLSSQPGVTASGSGPNVAKPVLRGLTGDRIRILTDGVGSLDVSSSSSDHAVAINPLTAESIEILHGPAALIYGSSAIGGVVNVLDARIPRRTPSPPLAANAIAGYATAANERLISGQANVPIAGHLVAHADASWTRNDDLRTGGYILAEPLRRQALASPDADIRALAGLRGDLPNSDGRSFEAAGAPAYVDGGLHIGGSITHHTALYGVPIRYSLDPSIEAEATHIDVHQTRYDARAEVPLRGLLRQIRVRAGYSDYRHAEIASDGTIGSQIYSKGGEARVDLNQRDQPSGWG